MDRIESSPRRWRAPAHSDQALVDPPPERSAALASANRKRADDATHAAFLFTPFQVLRREARRTLLTAARHHVAQYCDVVTKTPSIEWSESNSIDSPFAESREPPNAVLHEAPSDDSRASSRPGLSTTEQTTGLERSSNVPRIFLAGHQPELFHPGVWFKNFVLSRIAADAGATAINLVIDNDVPHASSIAAPSGPLSSPHIAPIPFDQPLPGDEGVPYEERPIRDAECFMSFGARIGQRMTPLGIEPMAGRFWPMVEREARRANRIGEAFAAARHLVERDWGMTTWEVPLSRLCDTTPFHQFVCEFVGRAGELFEAYNGSLADYRRRHRVRSQSHPVPALTRDEGWFEVPMWIWRRDDPRRRPLFVRRAGTMVELTDRGSWNGRMTLSEDGGDNGASAVERLAEWNAAGIRIRPRALATTMFARLLLGDLFLHGIGGGVYDQLTDDIVRRFFQIVPPDFMVATATLHLPFDIRSLEPNAAGDPSVAAVSASLGRMSQPLSAAGTRMSLSEPQRIREALSDTEAELRRLQWNPEIWLADASTRSIGMTPADANGNDERCSQIAELVAQKHRWVNVPRESPEWPRRFRAIRELNDVMAKWTSPRASELLARRDALIAAERRASILASREYSLVLFPEEWLRRRLLELCASTA